MEGLNRPVWYTAAIAAPIAGSLALALVLYSDRESSPALTGAVGLFVGWSFIGSGLVGWYRRPENAVGKLLVLIGFAWFAGALGLANSPIPFTVGMLVGPLPIALLLHVLLAFPEGHVWGYARRLVWVGYTLALGGELLILLLVRHPDHREGCDGCPTNVLGLANSHRAAQLAATAVQLFAFVVIVLAAVVLVRRWRRSSVAYRRNVTPVLATGGAALLAFGVHLALNSVTNGTAMGAAQIAADALLMTVPLALLWATARAHLARGSVAGLALELDRSGPGGLADALRKTLRDPSLVVLYRLPNDKWASVSGERVELPPEGPGLTMIEPVAAIVHDPALHAEPELLESALATAHLALENERLTAELAARLKDLKASRRRLVRAQDETRRRLERNLHDGAQQRLVGLSLALRLAQSKLPHDPDAAQAILVGASDELALALEELRELARGIHPAILTDRGLAEAVRALADRAPLAVDVKALPEERLPPPIEAAAYFVVAESLTNVAKYADASTVSVGVERVNGLARVEIVDDGVGGADPANGSGLRGLADRVEALDGSLAVVSPRGLGTVVIAEFPV